MRVDVGKPGLIMPGTSGFSLHPRDSISITLQDLLTPGCCIMAHVERHVRKLPAEPPDLLLTLLTICRALSLSLGQAQGRLVGACASPALPVNGLSRYPLPSRPRIPKCTPPSKTGSLSRCSCLVLNAASSLCRGAARVSRPAVDVPSDPPPRGLRQGR